MNYISVIIPSWNNISLLSRCLAVLQAQTFADFQITLVDNGSEDDTVQWVKRHYPQVQIIANLRNVGFAAAVNQGIRESESKYIATLNNDTEVEPEYLQNLVAVAESDDSVGMVASKMLFVDRPQMINSAGIAVDRLGIAWDRRGGEQDNPSEVEPVEIFGPCAGAALYRREMLAEIGLFDEDFFAYMEDVDLAWRARQAGWCCLYVPQAKVLHYHSATAKEGSPFKSFHLGRNKIWLLAKNYPFRELWYYVPLLILFDLAAVLYALIVRHDVHALRGRWAGLRGWRRMYQKRRQPLAGERTDIEFLEPVVWPWAVLRRYRHIRQSSVAGENT